MLSAFFVQGLLAAALLFGDELSEILDDAIDLFVVCGAFLGGDMVLNMVQGFCLVPLEWLIES